MALLSIIIVALAGYQKQVELDLFSADLRHRVLIYGWEVCTAIAPTKFADLVEDAGLQQEATEWVPVETYLVFKGLETHYRYSAAVPALENLAQIIDLSELSEEETRLVLESVLNLLHTGDVDLLRREVQRIGSRLLDEAEKPVHNQSRLRNETGT